MLRRSLLCLAVAVLVVGAASAQTNLLKPGGDPNLPSDIIGSDTVVTNVDTTDPDNVVITFTTTLRTENIEWLDLVQVTFPAGMTVTATSLVNPGDGDLVSAPVANMTGNVVSWENSAGACSGLGYLGTDGDFDWTATVSPGGLGGLQVVTYMMTGDFWLGGTESVVCTASDGCAYDGCLGQQSPDMVDDLEVEFPAPPPVPTLPLPATALLLITLVIVGTLVLRSRLA